MRRGTSFVASCLLAGLALAAPSQAAASTYCVDEPVCEATPGTVTPGTGSSGLKLALSTASSHKNAGGPDVVEVGPGVYTEPEGFSYSGEPVEVLGAGRGSTVLSSGSKDTAVLGLTSAGSTVSGMTLEMPEGEELTGLGLDGGTVEDVAIVGHGGPTISTGVELSEGVLRESSVELPGTGTGVSFQTGRGEVTDSTISAYYGTQGSVAETLRRCRIGAGGYGILGYYADITAEDTLIDLRGHANSWGVAVVGNANGNAEATLRQLTIVNGGGKSKGIEVGADGGASSAVRLEDSVIADVEHPIYEATESAGSKASLTASYSNYEAAHDEEVTNGGTKPAAPVEEHPVGGPPDFVAAVLGERGFSEGDWRLSPISPLIDAGTPGALASGESETDLAGDPRVVDGRRDVGAYEYQRRAPIVSATVAPLTVEVGRTVSFAGSASEPEPGDTVTALQWSFDDGASVPAGADASHAFSTVGMHAATLTATDVLGLTASAKVTVEVTPIPIVCAVSSGSCEEAPAPSGLSGLKLTPSSFAAARHGASIAHVHVGSRVGYDAAGGLRVTFSVERVQSGVRASHACLTPTTHRHGRSCKRLVPMKGSFARTSAPGANSFVFTGRLSGRALTPGRYVLVASFSVKGRTEHASADFTILR